MQAQYWELWIALKEANDLSEVSVVHARANLGCPKRVLYCPLWRSYEFRGQRDRQKSKYSERNSGFSREASTPPTFVRFPGARPHARRICRRVSDRFTRDGRRRAAATSTAAAGPGMKCASSSTSVGARGCAPISPGP